MAHGTLEHAAGSPLRLSIRRPTANPSAETDHQRTPLTYAVEALLRHHFRDRADVYVSERREEGMNTPAQGALGYLSPAGQRHFRSDPFTHRLKRHGYNARNHHRGALPREGDDCGPPPHQGGIRGDDVFKRAAPHPVLWFGAPREMTYTIDTVQDLVRVLDEHPQWLDALRARLLPPAVLRLPEQLADLAARVQEVAEQTRRFQAATEQRFDSFEQRFDGLEQRFDGLEQRFGRVGATV